MLGKVLIGTVAISYFWVALGGCARYALSGVVANWLGAAFLWGSHTPTRQKITDANTYNRARSHSPPRIRFRHSRLKEENIVYPRHIPTMTKIRTLVGTGYRPSGLVRVLKGVGKDEAGDALARDEFAAANLYR